MPQSTDPRQITYLPLAELQGDPRNPKKHDRDTINDSIGRFGMMDPIVRDDRTGYIVSGHGRAGALRAMQDRGDTPPEGVRAAEDGGWLVPVLTGWSSRSDAEAGAALIALNRSTELGGWDDDALLPLLESLNDEADGLLGVGYEEVELEDLRNYLDNVDTVHGLPEGRPLSTDLGDFGDGEDSEELGDTSEEAEDRPLEPSGQDFKYLDVLVGEPQHVVKHGEVYRLGGRHFLVIAKLANEHHVWLDLLPGRVFCPYPDVYLLLGENPKTAEHVLVQPNRYLAGHVLDKWTSVHGEESVELVEREGADDDR